MTLKLLFINASLTDGGSEKAMSLVAHALASRGHDVTMALVREKKRTYPLDPRIKVVQFRYGSKSKIAKAFGRVRRIRALLKADDHDYVVCYMWDLNVTTLIASLGLRRRIIISERNFAGASTRGQLWRLLERWSYQFAYKIVYQTQDAQKLCPQELLERSIVVPNMIEVGGASVHAGSRTRRVVSVGRFNAQKNFPLLLRSFARFAETNPDWILEIYGKGALEHDLRALAVQLGVVDSVVFAGYVPDVADRIRDAGMFVLSSDYEGISNAMTEAMALGLPVVCTDCPIGGVALMIEDRKSGMLVPVGDESALTDAMCEIATDETLAETISEGAQASVVRFAPEQLVHLWEGRVLC